jgi:regulator of nucleoside diphosphate kinase
LRGASGAMCDFIFQGGEHERARATDQRAETWRCVAVHATRPIIHHAKDEAGRSEMPGVGRSGRRSGAERRMKAACKLEGSDQMTIDNMTMRGSGGRPTIILSAEDHGRLSVLANAARRRMPDLADELADEVERARVLAAGEIPRDVVCMNSEVQFRDEASGRIQRMTLVYPDDANISERKVSVLTPVGTALVGLRSGDSVTWRTPAGEVRQLTVISVREPWAADMADGSRK